MPCILKEHVLTRTKLGQDLGCHVCLRRGEVVDSFPPNTERWLNFFCIQCYRLYCKKDASPVDEHFCIDCMPAIAEKEANDGSL